jgi:hypothetical protein
MPHAQAQPEAEEGGSGLSGMVGSVSDSVSGMVDSVREGGVSGVMDKVRNAPKGVLAAGAVVAGAAVAAAAIPLVKGALAQKGGKKSGGAKPRAKKGA